MNTTAHKETHNQESTTHEYAFFLEQCVHDILQKHSQNLHNLVIIFPNKRAIVFFKNYLQITISKPIFLPQLLTIEDFFLSKQPFAIPEKLLLIHHLHSIFVAKTKQNERIEDFYPWGELLLQDFDDIDKYLINADDLFKNLSSIKHIEDEFSYLSEEQKEFIARFWNVTNNFDASENQKKFIEIWSVLAELYHDYKKQLASLNIAYQGMATRWSIETNTTTNTEIFENKTHIFIGFNALNSCEKKLFSLLQEKKQALFYWDYDVYYNHASHEAGYFLHKNMKEYPNELDESYFQNFTQNKQIHIVETPNPISQVKQCGTFISECIGSHQSLEQSAIILADEHILVPLMQSLPPNIDYNISLGYPIKITRVFALFESILSLHQNAKNKSFYYKDILQICSHALLPETYKDLCVKLKNHITSRNIVYLSHTQCKEITHDFILFTPQSSPEEYIHFLQTILQEIGSQPSIESIDKSIIYTIFKQIQILEKLILSNAIALDTIQFINNLIKKAIQSQTIAIPGEPLNGLQIMGILETRVLDFKNIIILSVNENILPKKSIGASFIPYSLRTGFGLPTIKDQTAMYAYYFYRLLQRAQNITIMYATQSNDNASNEKSRYIQQLVYQSPFSIRDSSFSKDSNKTVSGIRQNNVIYPIIPTQRKSIIAEKTKKSTSYLLAIECGDKLLSPTSLHSYISCGLQFYFKYIEKIEAPKPIKELPDNADYGNFFHQTMEEIYKPYVNQIITKDLIDAILKNKQKLSDIIMNTISLVLKSQSSDFEKHKLHYNVIQKYVNNLLIFDQKQSPFTIVDLEKKLNYVHQSDHQKVHIGGSIDRLDTQNSSMRIIDYKTGKTKNECESIEGLFCRETNYLNTAIFQIFMYSYILYSENTMLEIVPQLLFLRDLHITQQGNIKIKDKKTSVTNYADIHEEFSEFFQNTINELTNPKIPFTQTENVETCKYCDFKGFCGR